jgi:hypothetical protein
MSLDDEDGLTPEDKLVQSIVNNTFRDKKDAELMQQAIEMTEKLRFKLIEQRDELRLLRDLVDRQQKLLFQKGII